MVKKLASTRKPELTNVKKRHTGGFTALWNGFDTLKRELLTIPLTSVSFSAKALTLRSVTGL